MYRFLLDAEQIATLIENARSVPETAITISRGRLTQGMDISNYQWLTAERIAYARLWHKSNGLIGYINPNANGTSAYTDLTVSCPCGAQLAHYHPNAYREWETPHTDDCDQFSNVGQQILEKQVRILRQCLEYNWPTPLITRRLLVSRQQLTKIAKRGGYSINAVRHEAKSKIAKTLHFADCSNQTRYAVMQMDQSNYIRWKNQGGPPDDTPVSISNKRQNEIYHVMPGNHCSFRNHDREIPRFIARQTLEYQPCSTCRPGTRTVYPQKP